MSDLLKVGARSIRCGRFYRCVEDYRFARCVEGFRCRCDFHCLQNCRGGVCVCRGVFLNGIRVVVNHQDLARDGCVEDDAGSVHRLERVQCVVRRSVRNDWQMVDTAMAGEEEREA